jgi:hypothetical protein
MLTQNNLRGSAAAHRLVCMKPHLAEISNSSIEAPSWLLANEVLRGASAVISIDVPIVKAHLHRGYRCLIAAASLSVASLLKSQALKLALKLCSRRKLREKTGWQVVQ